jgi:hypothetical protein
MTSLLARALRKLSAFPRGKRGMSGAVYGFAVAATLLGLVGVMEGTSNIIKQGMKRQTRVMVTKSDFGPPMPAIHLKGHGIKSYGGNQDQGGFHYHDYGRTVELGNNAWKKIDINIPIYAGTILAFDFKSTIQGEIHGIGFDSDDSISSNLTFRLWGTQSWGISTYADIYPQQGRDGYVHYEIPVGRHFTGNATRLTFVTDNDGGTRSNSFFKNIVIIQPKTDRP